MYKLTDIGSLYYSLPPNLQTVENDCLGYAVDKQMRRFEDLARKLTIWSDVDNADPRLYDQMAMTIRALYYKSEYSDDIKRELIKSAVATRRFAGTKKAIQLFLSKAFYESTFTPWYDYDDNPYYFKVVTDEAMTQDIADLFANALKDVIAARSHIRTVEVNRKLSQTFYSGGNVTGYSRPQAIMDGYATEESVEGEITSGVGGVVLSQSNNTIVDGYTTEESVEGVIDASTGSLLNMVSEAPLIREA